MSFGQAKLSNIEQPTFLGEIRDWIKFRDKFEEMTAKRKNIANIYKLDYLCAALKGEALALLDNQPSSSDNFENAWKTIKGFYNTRLMISELVTKLLSMSPMSSGAVSEITRLRTSTKNILQALKVLGSPVDQWDYFTVLLTVSRLTSRLQSKWEGEIAKSENPRLPPSYTSLDEFLEVERLAAQQLENSKKIVLFNEEKARGEKRSHASKDRLQRSDSRTSYKSVHLSQDTARHS